MVHLEDAIPYMTAWRVYFYRTIVEDDSGA